MTSSKSIIPADYAHWLSSLKTRISGAQQRAALAVNQELVRLYHSIGSEILDTAFRRRALQVAVRSAAKRFRRGGYPPPAQPAGFGRQVIEFQGRAEAEQASVVAAADLHGA